MPAIRPNPKPVMNMNASPSIVPSLHSSSSVGYHRSTITYHIRMVSLACLDLNQQHPCFFHKKGKSVEWHNIPYTRQSFVHTYHMFVSFVIQGSIQDLDLFSCQSYASTIIVCDGNCIPINLSYWAASAFSTKGNFFHIIYLLVVHNSVYKLCVPHHHNKPIHHMHIFVHIYCI